MAVIVSEATRRAASGFVREAVRIHEPVGRPGDLDAVAPGELERFHRAVELLRSREFEEARRRLLRMREGDPGERASHYQVYLRRAESLLHEPPGPGWDGTVEFTDK